MKKKWFKNNLDIEEYGFLVMALGIVIACALVMGFAYSASAGVSYENYGVTGSSTGNVQIAGIELVMCKAADNDTGTFYFELYKDDPFSSFLGSSTVYSFASLEYESNIDANCITGLQVIFPSYPTLTNGTEYFFVLRENSANNAGIPYTFPASGDWRMTGICDSVDCDAAASVVSPDSFDIITLAEWTADVEIIDYDWGYDYVQIGSAELNIRDKNCISGETCDLKLYYGFEHIGHFINIYETDSAGTPTSLFATTTLSDIMILREEFEMASQAAGTTKYYKAYDTTTGDTSYVATIKWWDEDDLADTEWNVADACSDMASTTWEFWNPTTWAGGMGYALECSFRKAGYWAFTVKPSTYMRLSDAKENIVEEFPFNIFYVSSQLIDLASSSATSTWSIPVEWIESSTTIATMDLSNATIKANYPTLWEKFMLMQTIVFYAFGFGMIFYLSLKILKIGNKQEE